MRVLVTGGSGYVGSSTVRELADAGHDILIYDNLSTGHPKLADGFELVQGDIADKERLRPCLRHVDAVMHFAASAYVGESVENPRKYFHNNVESALALMDCVIESDVRLFIFSSSCAVYGIPLSLPIFESSRKEPINPYGATKLFFERVLSAFNISHGLRYVALRYFNAAGAHPSAKVGEIHTPETHLIPLAIKSALGSGPPLTIFGRDLDTRDGTCVRDFIHVCDLGVAHLKALQYLAGGGASVALNLGTGRGTSIAEVLGVIEAISHRRVPHIFAPPRVGDPPTLFAEAVMAKAILGWEARFDLEQIIAGALRWEEQLPEFLKNS
ncbi:MAG TPA: UDP-glucose 4-epimerase GalE [Terracidiphilus sp.]|nr:UDP-glucose 4-epimerase GalE [Terracidiphilus sp.]